MPYTITRYVVERHEWATSDPSTLRPGVMQVFYEGDVVRMVDFLCPCGCGNRCPTHVITMAEKMDQERQQQSEWERHCWGFDANTVTLHPSIRWTGGCKAHFNITNGEVFIHPDSGK